MINDECVTQTDTTNLYARVEEDARRVHRLFRAHWELTHRCNEVCSHCYLEVMPSGARVPRELNTEQCFHVIDEMTSNGILHLTLSGGELLVRRDWHEIASYARSKRMLLRLFTNGILVTPTVADQIASLHPFMVEISVYGVCAETHEFITRVRGSFERTIRALQLLHERGVRTMLKTPFMHHNVHEFSDLQTLARELGAQFRYSTSITTTIQGGVRPLIHRLTDDDLRLFLSETLREVDYQPHPVEAGQGSCGVGLSGILVDPHGDVFPCVETRLLAGNVATTPLRTIWDTSPVFKQARGLTWDELPECRACDVAEYCHRCHGIALNENGNLYGAASELCREAYIRRDVVTHGQQVAEESQMIRI